MIRRWGGAQDGASTLLLLLDYGRGRVQHAERSKPSASSNMHARSNETNVPGKHASKQWHEKGKVGGSKRRTLGRAHVLVPETRNDNDS